MRSKTFLAGFDLLRRGGFRIVQHRPFRFSYWLCGLTCLSLTTLTLCHGEEGEGIPAFRRLLLSPDQLPRQLQRVEEGTLIRLPLAEFDTLVEKAKRRSNNKKAVPRLLEAHYHATLRDEALIGEGQWKIVHPGPAAGLLTLEPFNLALRQARLENGNALIAAFDGKDPSLLLETAGEHTVSLDWSARAEAGPDGLQFHLEIPPCPIMVVELDVPTGRGVRVLNDGAFLSDPQEAESVELRRWKIVCGGRRTLDLRILPADVSSSPNRDARPPFYWLKTVHKLNAQGLDATFELTLGGPSRGIRELHCECDPELRVREVLGPHIDSYAFKPATGNRPAHLTIRLRETVSAGTWQIHCLGPFNPSPASHTSGELSWRTPGLRLLEGVSRGETLSIVLDPDLRVDGWDAGNYRLSSAEIDRSSGMQVLTMIGGGLGPVNRPVVRLQRQRVEYRAFQLALWRCDAAGMALTLQIGWDVTHGRLFQLPLELPADWSVDRVEMTPSELRYEWRVRQSAGRKVLTVDLQSPLTPRPLSEPERPSESTSRSPFLNRGRMPIVTVHLRPGWSGPLTEKKLAFPDAVPLGARFREGALALDWDEQLFQVAVQTKAKTSEPEGEGPWGQRLPASYYRYRGQAVTGELRVRPRPPRIRVNCKSDVFVASGRAAVETHLQLEAEAGSTATIELLFSAGDGSPWQWQTEPTSRNDDSASVQVHHVERLRDLEMSAVVQLFAPRTPLQAASVLPVWPTGERWRLTLTRPLRNRESLRLHARKMLTSHQNTWDVPLPLVLGADHLEGEVRLSLAGLDHINLLTMGLREAAGSLDKGATPWRAFRYGSADVRLILTAPNPAGERNPVAVIDDACLVTQLTTGGSQRCRLSFQVSNWGQRTLPLRLPPHSCPLAAQVDGHWLPRVISPEAPRDASEASADETELELPVPARGEDASDRSSHHFVVVYTREVASWQPWQVVQSPAPILPLVPLSLRRVWRLPTNRVPLDSHHYLATPGKNVRGSQTLLPRQIADLFHLPGRLVQLDPMQEVRRAETQRVLDTAIREICSQRAKQTIALGDVLSELAFVHLKDRYPLVIDTLALRRAGIGPQTPLTLQAPPQEPGSFWIEHGLALVPTRWAVVLTSASGSEVSFGDPLGVPSDQAISSAQALGQDPSGRFRTVLNWLSSEFHSSSPAIESGQSDWDSDGSDGIEWEALAGAEGETLIVVRNDVVRATGLLLTIILGLLFWMLRGRSARGRLTLLLFLIGVAGVGVLWLPSGLHDLAWIPLLAISLSAALWYLRNITRPDGMIRVPSRNTNRVVIRRIGAGIVLLTIVGWNGQAAAPDPVTVFLIPGPAESPDKQSVLVPAELLQRLKSLVAPPPLVPGGPPAVLLDATYEGRIVDGQAEFTAVFAAFCLTEEARSLSLPLAGVQLFGDVWLDGARTHPQALAAPRSGYALNVRGRGRHKIELHFRVPVTGTEEDRNVLFTVPPLVRSQLTWHIPAGAVDTQMLVKYGAQRIVREAGAEKLEVDLGNLPRPLHLHWHQPVRPTQVRYQAAYLWDLGLDSHRLTAWLRYDVRQGAVKSLELDLPDDLEVSSAIAQRLLPSSPPTWLTRFQLRDWQVRTTDRKRRLYLQLPYPISGEFQVTLELVPRSPFAALTSLSLPAPRGVAAEGVHYLAYRTRSGLNGVRYSSQNITRIDADKFAADWPSVPRLEEHFSGAAYTIRPEGTPLLRLQLHPSPPLLQAEMNLRVQAGAQLAEVQVTADLKTPNKDLVAIAWDLQSPQWTVASVTGEDVRSWQQSGQHLVVWLQRTAASTHIQLTGWLPMDRSRGPSSLDFPGPRLLQAQQQHTHVRLLAASGLSLSSVESRNLQPIQPPGPLRLAAEQEQTFQTQETSYGLRCEVQAASNATARVLTLAEVSDRQLRFTTIVNYEVGHGSLRQVQLRLRNWEDEKVELQAESVALWGGPRRSSGERSWQLTLLPGIRGTYQVTLRGSMPVEDATVGVPMPDVTVQGVENVEYYLAVASRELSGQARGLLKPLNSRDKALTNWPGAAQRVERTGGQIWRVEGSEWKVQLLPHALRPESAPIQVFLLKQSVGLRDGQRWLHEVHCWFRHEANSELTLDFPAPIRVLAAGLDDGKVTPLQPNPSRVWLPLPGKAGVRLLRLRWLYSSSEPVDRPTLAQPTVMDAIPGPSLWTVMVPPGWEVVRSDSAIALGSGAMREATMALHRAEAQLRISQDLCRQRRDRTQAEALAMSAQRFAALCRHARQALELADQRREGEGSQGKKLAAWLTRLQAEYRELANQNDLKEPSPEPAPPKERPDGPDENNSAPRTHPPREWSTSVFEKGTPLSWQAQPGEGSLVLQLSARDSERQRQALVHSGQWLGGLVVIWICSFFPILTTTLRRLWPEQIALFGLVGWYLVGFTTIVVCLILIALIGRVFLLMRGVRSFLVARRQEPSTITAASANRP